MEQKNEINRGTIVVIDDTPANLRLLTGMLTNRGYKVRPVPSGELGIQSVLASPPDLILLDINMPDINGYEVCRQLKENKTSHSVPVIFISALDETLDKVKAFNVGGVDYITKPFQLEEVMARIRTQLELKYARDGLSKVNRSLEQALEEKGKLMGVMVHDLKNPLNALRGYAELLIEEPDISGEEMAQIAAKMVTNSKQMSNVVANIIEIEALESGRRTFTQVPIDPSSLLTETSLAYEKAALAKDIRIEVDLGEPGRAYADETAVYGVLRHLISNAIKFSPQGSLILLKMHKDDDLVWLEVHDQGPGLTEDDRNRLFSKYAQLSAKPTGGESSTGLGLSIVKLIAEASGGRIEAFNREDGSGACFRMGLQRGFD